MPVFLKDFIALLSIVGFTGGTLHVDGHGVATRVRPVD